MGTNRKPDKVWQISYDGHKMTVDDMTFPELEAIENATGTPWAFLNPWRSASVAQAFLALLLMRNGKTDDEAKAIVGSLRARDFKACFDLVDDDRPTYYDDNAAPVIDPKASGAPATGS